MHHHISQHFTQQLATVNGHMLTMGGLVEKQFHRTMRALINADSELAIAGIEDQQAITTLANTIDEACMHIIIRHQPTAGDLRWVMTLSKLVTKFKATSKAISQVAQVVMALTEQADIEQNCVDMGLIGDPISAMLHDTLDAFARFDGSRTSDMLQQQQAVSTLCSDGRTALLQAITTTPQRAPALCNIIWILHLLERISGQIRAIADVITY